MLEGNIIQTSKKYKSTGDLPSKDDDGIAGGRPKLIPSSEIQLLNELLQTIRYAEGVTGLHNVMISTIKKLSDFRNEVKQTRAPCRQTLDRYHIKAALIDKTMSLVKTCFTMSKTSRRQMTLTSVRNLMSHICEIAYSNFFSCATRWEHYYKVSKGA